MVRYFGAQAYDPGARVLGEGVAAMPSRNVVPYPYVLREEVCVSNMRKALTTLAADAKAKGGYGVVEVKTEASGKTLVSETSYLCADRDAWVSDKIVALGPKP